MTYRKKRIRPAPNKNAAKVHRRESSGQSETTIGTLGSNVSHITMQLSFYDTRGNQLDQRTESFGPADGLELQIDCLGPCGNGKIDLEGKLRDMVQKHETSSEGRAKCAQTLYAGSSDVCGHELRCHFQITYND